MLNKTKKRLGSGILILTIMMCTMVGFVAYSTSMLAGSTFNTLESSGVALKAQQLAKNRADEIFVLSYKKMDDAAEVRKNISGTNLYRETVVTPGEITNPDGTKQRELNVKIYKNDTDTTPIFSLPLVRTKGINPPGVPVGTVIWFAGINPPEGFLVCNGQSTTGYPELASIVGSSVPNLEGKFIRGWDNGAGIDSGRIFSSIQSDDFKSHTHAVAGDYWVDGKTEGINNSGMFAGRFWQMSGYVTNSPYGYPYIQKTGGTETRPINVALLPCIKHD